MGRLLERERERQIERGRERDRQRLRETERDREGEIETERLILLATDLSSKKEMLLNSVTL